MAVKKWGNFHSKHDMTIGEICSDLGRPEIEVRHSMTELEITPDFSVGGIGVFSQQSFQRIKVAIISAANKKALAKI